MALSVWQSVAVVAAGLPRRRFAGLSVRSDEANAAPAVTTVVFAPTASVRSVEGFRECFRGRPRARLLEDRGNVLRLDRGIAVSSVADSFCTVIRKVCGTLRLICRLF